MNTEAKKTLDVLCMGRVGVDLYAEQINKPLKDVKSFKKYLGGSPANISVGCARLGLKTALFSGIGKDAMGVFLKEKLIKEKVDVTNLIEFEDNLTALAILGILPPDRFPLIFYRNDCADMQLNSKYINAKMIKNAKYFLFSGTGISTPSMRKTTFDALIIAKSAGSKIILDIDYRPVLWGLTPVGDGETRFKDAHQVSLSYQKFLPFCDMVVGTKDELAIASSCSNATEAINKIQQLAAADIVYKKGVKGSEVFLNKEKTSLTAQTFIVDVLNTLGAGDAYLSGLLYGLLNNKGWHQSLLYANASGAIVSSRHSCSEAMPSVNELDYFLYRFEKQGKDIVNDAHFNELHQQTIEKSIKAPCVEEVGG